MANITATSNAGAATALAARSAATDAKSAAAQPLDRVRLDRLRSAIQAGQYPLDAGKLAAKMLDLKATSGK